MCFYVFKNQIKPPNHLIFTVIRRFFTERRRRDLNPRAAFTTYTLSRGASSATWVLLHIGRIVIIIQFTKCPFCIEKGHFVGGETEIRTLGSFESLVFKTSSLNHSDISPFDRTLSIIAENFVFVNTFFQFTWIILYFFTAFSYFFVKALQKNGLIKSKDP